MKMLEITSYMEVVNDSHMAELSHPAFNKLFIESEYLQGKDIFLSKRRSNKSVEKPYVMQMLRTGSKLLYPVEYENNRAKFIGRNNTSEYPDAVMHSKALSNTSGFCNDPIMSLRATLNIKPGEEVTLVFLTGVCESREEAIRIGEELKSSYLVDDLLKKYKLQSEVELKYLEISGAQLNAFQNIIGAIFYPSYDYRRSEQSIIRNSKNQSFLWKFGISGDNPILLLKVASIEDEAIIRDVIKAYEYLRINNLAVDLIILIEAKYGYLQEVDYLINDLTSSLKIYENDNEKPGFFVLHTYQLIPAEIDLLYTVARLVFDEKKGIYFKSI
jgi:cellobiose phosphorylase